MKVLPPWNLVSDCLPKPGQNVLWVDVDGSYHLGRLENDHMIPVAYMHDGELAEVQRQLSWHVCWMEIEPPKLLGGVFQAPWVGRSTLPEAGAEVVWSDYHGEYHLSQIRGRYAYPAVYETANGSPSVKHLVSRYRCWLKVDPPQVASA